MQILLELLCWTRLRRRQVTNCYDTHSTNSLKGNVREEKRRERIRSEEKRGEGKRAEKTREKRKEEKRREEKREEKRKEGREENRSLIHLARSGVATIISNMGYAAMTLGDLYHAQTLFTEAVFLSNSTMPEPLTGLALLAK
jgi:hypothetical protein